MDRVSHPTVLFSDRSPDIVLADGGHDVPATDSVMVMAHAATWVLRQVRQKRGLVLSGFADRCGVSVPVMSRLERSAREPRLYLLLAMCNLLGVRFSEVMRIAEDEAFPVGDQPWTDHVAELIDLVGYSADVSPLGGDTKPKP
jgi:transcriptional regulator with XRE-family HTH domain